MGRLTRSIRDDRPLSVRVYETLRDRIVSGELVAETALIQEQVAEDLGVSRTPVRDALTRLAHEGMVTWVTGRGYVVNALTEQDVGEVLEVRTALELLAVRRACGRHDRLTLATLNALIEEIRQPQARRCQAGPTLATLNALIEEMAATDPGDSAQQFDLNRRFHRAFVAPSGNSLLLRQLETLWEHPVNRRITRSYVTNPGNVDRMVSEHRELVAAAAAADLELLLKLSEQHLKSGYAEAADVVDRTRAGDG